ncbi:hypothetical protein ACFVFQ_35770 [Streptomyces sp. NPDC057743]|uniref:hypothetical protein n=1 Tax=Streptomyces sp. NPDC057743 TaxID=3346236 RepID=UPI0036C007C7
MQFKKGDHVGFSTHPDEAERTERGTVVEVTQGRKGESHYEVRRDADPSGPDYFFGENDVEKV